MEDRLHLWEDLTQDPSHVSRVNELFDQLIFNKQSAILQESRSLVQITQIELVRFLWAQAKTLREERDLSLRQRPSQEPPQNSGYRHQPGEYEVWSLDLFDAPSGFTEDEIVIPVPGSEHIEVCEDCDGHGAVVCQHCGGSGQLVCGCCGGGGDVVCNSCGGYGYHEHQELRGGGSEGSPYYVTFRQTCGSCGGSGRQVCGSCGGSGRVSCNSCNGHGTVTCSTCQGCGAVIFDVVARQAFLVNQVRSEVSHLDQLRTLFPAFSPTFPENDQIPLLTANSHGPFSEADITPCFHADELQRYVDLPAIAGVVDRARAGADHLIRQSLALYDTPVYYVHFCFREQEYQCLLDPAAGTVHFDRNPFVDLLDAQLVQLRTLRKEQSYAAMDTLAKRIMELAVQDTSFSAQAAACRKESRGVHLKFFLLQLPLVVVGWGLLILLYFVLRGFGQPFPMTSLLPPVASVAAAWLVGYLRPKLPCSNEKQFLITAVVSSLITGPLLSALLFILFVF